MSLSRGPRGGKKQLEEKGNRARRGAQISGETQNRSGQGNHRISITINKWSCSCALLNFSPSAEGKANFCPATRKTNGTGDSYAPWSKPLTLYGCTIFFFPSMFTAYTTPACSCCSRNQQLLLPLRIRLRILPLVPVTRFVSGLPL